MKIICKVSGYRRLPSGDWTLRASDDTLLEYFKSHRKEFCIGYEFIVQNVKHIVTSITEKQKPEIKFSTVT